MTSRAPIQATAPQVVEFLREARLVAIIRLPDLSAALPLAQALIAGGFRALEFTLNSPGALDAIAQVSNQLPEVLRGEVAIGAGTVLRDTDAEAAIEAGAQFIISPTIKPDVIDICKAQGIAVIPGAFTPNEIETAWELGADVVKVFPSRALEPKYIRELHGPFPEFKLMPTGGIELEQVRAFLEAGAWVVGVGGTALLNTQAIAAAHWDDLSTIAQRYIAESI
ncbi:MAG: bifunctional 4-hydroxy-2-oxoglutarate aldolase/2-dehydro-3-deoxy-phosphogluconate aldolase [Armatimonadetes bacterium]|nr:bifunctional 4-hydroxy-2-oxoglutarate aldolase/2-dehydro-3-deoxy-phosphogluconate aldolase [Anaerolineae bacterium]